MILLARLPISEAKLIFVSILRSKPLAGDFSFS
jgi:hypothetical protein